MTFEEMMEMASWTIDTKKQECPIYSEAARLAKLVEQRFLSRPAKETKEQVGAKLPLKRSKLAL